MRSDSSVLRRHERHERTARRTCTITTPAWPAAPGARALVAAAVSAGCATREQSTDSFLGFITPYRVEIVQGNAVTREQATRVKPGMTRAQVRDILGSPMLTDQFHADRWDYLFTIRRQGTEPQRRSVVA